MRIEKATVAVAVLSALAAAPALAADAGPRYTYAEVGYIDVELDNIGDLGIGADGDGFTVDGSFAVHDNWHVFASFADGDVDVDDTDVSLDLQQLVAGVGFNYGVADATDLVIRAAYVDLDVEDFDDSGYGLSAGIRSMVMPQLELNASLDYTDIGDFEDDTAFTFGGVWNFTDMFAVVGSASFGSDSDQYGLGVRAYFGSK